jgi:hypothetical protein
MSRLGSIALAALAASLAVATAAIALSHWDRRGHAAPPPRLELAGTQLRIAQTMANRALIRLPNAKPGQVARGTTSVQVTGSTARLSVRPTNLRDLPGRNGGRLIGSRRLWIDVRCALRPCPRQPAVYRGPLRDMGRRSLGTWRVNTRRTYSVRVWLLRGPTPPSNRTGDNSFQGSRATFGLVWNATAP